MPFSPKLARFQGEWAEACFIAKAMSKGLRVSKPFGDSLPYDFITQSRRGLLRVQVKSISRKKRNRYSFSAIHDQTCYKTYSQRDIDIFVAFIIPEDAWYIIPVARVRSVRALYLYPHRVLPRPFGRFEKFREAWHYLL